MHISYWCYLRVLCCFDVSHRCWNDIQLGLRDADVWGLVLLCTICFNFDHGPWKDGKWIAERSESTKLYVSMTSPDYCPLFQSLVRKIIADKHDEDRTCDEGFVESIFLFLLEAHGRLRPNVAATRWFGFIDAAVSFLKRWHRRLLAQLFLCIRRGLTVHMNGEGGPSMKLLVLTPDIDVPKGATAADS